MALALNLALCVPELRASGAPHCGRRGLRPEEVTPSCPCLVGPPSFRALTHFNISWGFPAAAPLQGLESSRPGFQHTHADCAWALLPLALLCTNPQTLTFTDFYFSPEVLLTEFYKTS